MITLEREEEERGDGGFGSGWYYCLGYDTGRLLVWFRFGIDRIQDVRKEITGSR